MIEKVNVQISSLSSFAKPYFTFTKPYITVSLHIYSVIPP